MTRITTALIAAALALPAALAPAAAQVRQDDPNAADRSLARMGQDRAVQQELTTRSDTTMMNAERVQDAPPPPPVGVGPTVRVGP